MPRLRRASAGSFDGGPPLELLDSGHPLWQSKARTKAWLIDRDLAIGAALEWGPLNRHKAAMFAWAKRAGLTRPPMPSGFVGFDYERMREIGLPAAGGCGARREQLQFEGVVTFAV